MRRLGPSDTLCAPAMDSVLRWHHLGFETIPSTDIQYALISFDVDGN
jgi:hypothetical protein